jgi:hypothetical protein
VLSEMQNYDAGLIIMMKMMTKNNNLLLIQKLLIENTCKIMYPRNVEFSLYIVLHTPLGMINNNNNNNVTPNSETKYEVITEHAQAL